ncbi:MAG: bifunctional adenosylcobinamide kinase/adenosylcobinamide-phosphate guanylyltransferase [Acidimicrobiia bacterium]
MITLVLGGARSGKSAVAEARAREAGGGVTYLATARPLADDADWAARIEAHRARRPASWTTLEAWGTELGPILARATGTVLVDSLGTWVAGHDDLDPDPAPVLAALVARAGTTVVVSDEVGWGVHPATEVGRRFRDVLGEVNQAVAAVADEVVLVVAGRTLRLG